MSQKKIIGNFFSLGAVQIANYVLPLLSVPIISRIIGPEKFGIINYAGAFMMYFNLLIGYGFDLSATRKLSKKTSDQGYRNELFSLVLFTKLLLFVISLILFLLCIYFIAPLSKEKIVSLYSFIFCFSIVLSQNWFFQAMQDLGKVAILNFISRVAFTVIILIVVRNQNDYIYHPLINSSVQVVVGLISMLWAIHKYNIVLVKINFRDVFHQMWVDRFVFFSLVVISLYTSTNIVVLGLFKSPLEVGYYVAGIKLIEVSRSVFNIPLSQALYPYIGSCLSSDKVNGILIVKKIMPLIIISTGLFGGFLFAFGPIFLKLFYGTEYAPAIIIFQILTFLPMLLAIGNILGVQLMLNLSMDKVFFRITTVGALFSIVSNLVLIKYIGYVGTALNWLLTELFITTTMYLFLRNKQINIIDLSLFTPSVVQEMIKNVFKKNRNE